MFCDNNDCDHTTFAESFLFLRKKSKKTERFIEEIIHVSKSMSAFEAEDYLRKNVVKVGRSTICELLKRGPKIVKEGVQIVCIADFAFRKG